MRFQLSKWLLGTVAVTVIICSSSCINILEVIKLNKSGGGSYTITLEPGAGLTSGLLFADAFQSALQEVGDSLANDPEDKKTGKYRLSYDSVFYFKNAHDTTKAKWLNPEIMQSAYTVVKVRAADKNMLKSELSIEAHFDFTVLADIKDFTHNLQFSADKFELLEMDSKDFIPWGVPTYSLEGNTLSRGQDDFSEHEAMSIREQKIAKALVQSSTYTLEIIFPGKVKEVSNEDYERKGKQVSIVAPIDEFMDGEIPFATTVTFK